MNNAINPAGTFLPKARMSAIATPLIGLALAAISGLANAATTGGNLQHDDFVGISFWIISMTLVAATVFFFLERDRVSPKWKTSLSVSGLVTLVAAVHYFYMRDQ